MAGNGEVDEVVNDRIADDVAAALNASSSRYARRETTSRPSPGCARPNPPPLSLSKSSPSLFTSKSAYPPLSGKQESLLKPYPMMTSPTRIFATSALAHRSQPRELTRSVSAGSTLRQARQIEALLATEGSPYHRTAGAAGEAGTVVSAMVRAPVADPPWVATAAAVRDAVLREEIRQQLAKQEADWVGRMELAGDSHRLRFSSSSLAPPSPLLPLPPPPPPVRGASYTQTPPPSLSRAASYHVGGCHTPSGRASHLSGAGVPTDGGAGGGAVGGVGGGAGEYHGDRLGMKVYSAPRVYGEAGYAYGRRTDPFSIARLGRNRAQSMPALQGGFERQLSGLSPQSRGNGTAATPAAGGSQREKVPSLVDYQWPVRK